MIARTRAKSGASPFARRYTDGRTKAEQQRSHQALQPRSKFKANCTHIHMARLYGRNTCDQCGRHPSFGWLYVCTQDNEAARADPAATAVDSFLDDDDNSPTTSDSTAVLALSSSVRAQIRGGLYTPVQIERLKEQKRKVQKTITQSTRSNSPVNQRPSPATYKRAERSITPSMAIPHKSDLKSTTASLVSKMATLDGTEKSAQEAAQILTPCQYKCCHRCRPHFQDRLHTSFEVAFSSQTKPVTREEALTLPVLDAAIVCRFGLQTPRRSTLRPINTSTPSSSTDSTSMAVDALEMPDASPSPSLNMTPSPAPSTDGCYEKMNIISDAELDRQMRDVSAVPLPPDTPPASAQSPELHKAVAHKLRRVSGTVSPAESSHTASPPLSNISTSSPNTVSTTSTPPDVDGEDGDVSRRRSRYSMTSDNHRHNTLRHGHRDLSQVNAQSRSSSTDSLVSEIDGEVDGGVALTEEAIATHTPDLITQV